MKEETVTLAWCDNGMVDGLFAQGMADTLLKSKVKFKTTLRSAGNQIARQRETVLRYWYDNEVSDWLFWLDSDVVCSPEIFNSLWEKKDRHQRPIISGVYFTTDNPEQPLMYPKPTIFEFIEKEDGNVATKRIHPMPENKFIKIGAAGMGLVLMHRNAIKRIIEEVPDSPFFSEAGVGTKFIGEDIFFFALCHEAGVPVWADTGATAPHMKRFSYDVHYYNAMTQSDKE